MPVEAARRRVTYEGWHSTIAANKVAANTQTKISTHWSRVIRGSIENGPASRGEDGRGHTKAPSVEGGQRKTNHGTFIADRWSLFINAA